MAATLPTLPTAYSLAAYSLPTGTERYCYGDSGADATYTVTLQSALNDCVNGDVLILKAGETYTGNFVAPVKGSGDPIYIISSAMASLPAEGTRVSPSDAANMPKVTNGTVSINPTLIFETHATSAGGTWRVCGIEVATDYTGVGGECYQIIRIGWTATLDSINDDTVDEVILDRCWIHGKVGGNVQNGVVTWRVDQVAVVDCYVNEIHSAANETKGIWLAGGAGTGPFLIRNNYISACSQCFFIYDSPYNLPAVNPEAIPQDVTFEQNVCEKLSSWHSGRPDYGGIDYGCKYGIEFKAATRVLIQGNIIRDMWTDTESGAPIVLTAKGNHITDITIRRNFIYNVSAGITIQSSSPGVVTEIHRVLMEDNVFNQINRAGEWMCGVSSIGAGQATDVTIQHNTFLCSDNDSPGTLYLSGAEDGIDDLEFYNNIIVDTGSTVAVAGNGASGRAAAVKFCTTFDFDTNVAISDQTSYWGADTNWTNWSQEAAEADVGFTDTTFDDLADYALLGSSDYYEAGTDSEDIGADIDAITAALSGDDYSETTYYIFQAGGLTFGAQT